MDIWKGKAELIKIRLSICTKNAKAKNFDSPTGKKVQLNIGLFERLLQFFPDSDIDACKFGFYYTTMYSRFCFCSYTDSKEVSYAELLNIESEGTNSKLPCYTVFDDTISNTDAIDNLTGILQQNIHRCLDSGIVWLTQESQMRYRYPAIASILLQDSIRPHKQRLDYYIDEMFSNKDRTNSITVEYENLIFSTTPNFHIIEFLDRLIDEGRLLRWKNEYQGLISNDAEMDIRVACRYILEYKLRNYLYEHGYQILWKIGREYLTGKTKYFTVPPAFLSE